MPTFFQPPSESRIVSAISAAIPGNIRAWHDNPSCTFIVRWDFQIPGRLFQHQLVYMDQAIESMVGSQAEAFICRDFIDRWRRDSSRSIGEYPDVRLWVMQHLLRRELRSTDPIPGWAWPRWNAAHPGMKANKQGGIEPKDNSTISHIPNTPLNPIDIEDDSMPPKSARKVVVVRPQGKNVKKPHCVIHTDLEMKFNPLRQLWECVEPACNIISRPKVDRDQGSVVLGKGKLELRLVYTDPAVEPRLVLISDDNIALDITDYVNMSGLAATFDVRGMIRRAKASGDSVAVSAAKDAVTLYMKLNILGVENA